MTTEKLRQLIREAIDEVLNESCAACAESTEPCEECSMESSEPTDVKNTDDNGDEPGRGWETDVGAKMDPRETDPTGGDYDPDEFREWLNKAKDDPAIQLVLKEYVNHKDKTKANTILLSLYKKKRV